MRTKVGRSALAVLVLVALGAAGCGGGDEENFFSPLLSKFRHRVHGTVSRVDAVAKTFTVKDKMGREFSFVWTDRTLVEGALADGATATVRYRNEGEKTATKVKIFGAPAPPAATSTSAPAPAETKKP